MDLNTRICAVPDSVTAHRRWLHAHPELSGQEERTATKTGMEVLLSSALACLAE